MSIAEKLLTVAENEKKIHDEVVGQSDLIAQIKAKVNSLPEAGGGEKPTLFAPTIALNSVSSELTITDKRNGDFVPWYDLYIGGKKITTLTSKTATLTDYIEHTETMNVYVQSNLTNFNSIESNVVEWVKFAETDGTAGLAYSVSSDGSYAICTGIGVAVDTDIEIASTYEGLSVKEIADSAFKDNANITSVVIPYSVKTIVNAAFSGCSKLKNVEIGDGVETISPSAFFKCTSLNTVVVGSGVTSIGSAAFYHCDYLLSIDFSKHAKVPTLESYNVFTKSGGYFTPVTIKVPSSLLSKWKTATNWSNYANQIVGV